VDKKASSSRQKQIQELFEQLYELPPDQRLSLLGSIGRKDAGLRHDVETLLQRVDPANEHFERMEQTLLRENQIIGQVEKPGTRIDNYTLIEPIGEGGFGMVWLARQGHPVRRRVALKIIKIGMDTREVVARFEAERQALAMMEHPGIAMVHDAGATASGRPYFVMELVRGTPITRYCDEQRLSTTKRLELFTEVCHAVQHAHQKGIIHRDIKPSNILVSVHDGKPVPKIIDFGIAKATTRQLTDKTLHTRLHTFMGTPVYCSPEQIEGTGLDIDTRSDIYSLGVVLYELLTGSLPFDPDTLANAGFERVSRTIREVDPPRPSTQVKSLSREEATEIAQQRGTEPGRLTSLLHGDLDWIVLHCLEKDRARRYETANELASDIRRHLHHRPIIARPPTAAYRMRKFVFRNKALVSGVAAVMAAMLLGIAGSTWQAVRAMRAEQATAAALQSEALARKESEVLHFDTHSRHLTSENPWGGNTNGLAHAIASLERIDSPERRRLALEALWTAPLYFVLKPMDGLNPCNSASFTLDGNRLITCSHGAEVLLWPADGGPPQTLPGDPGYQSLSFNLSHSGKRLLVTYEVQGAPLFTGPWKQVLWDMDSLAPIREWNVDTWGPLSFSPDESWLFAFSLERETPYPGVARWMLDDERIVPLGTPVEEPPIGLRFPPLWGIQQCYVPSEDMQWLVSWKDQDIFVSPIGAQSLGKTVWIGREEGPVHSVSISPRGELVSSGGPNWTSIWSRKLPGDPLARLPSSWASANFDLPHSRVYASWPDVGGSIVFYDLRAPIGSSGTLLHPIQSAPGALDTLPGGDWVVLTGGRKLGNRETHFYAMRAVWPFHVDTGLAETPVQNCLRFSPDHRQVAFVNRGRILLMDLSSDAFPKRVVYEAPGNLVIYRFEFSPDGESLIVGTHRDGAWLVPLKGGVPRQIEGAPSFTSTATFSPGGERIAVGGGFADLPPEERYPRVLDRKGRLLARIAEGGSEEVRDLKFIRETELVVSTAGGLRLWNIATNAVSLLRSGPHGKVVVSENHFLVNDTEGFWLYDYPSLAVKKLAMEPTWTRDTALGSQAMAIAPNERFIVTRETRGTLCVQYIDEDRYHLLPSNDGWLSDLWVSDENLWLGAINQEGKLAYWPVPEGEPLHDRPLEEFLEILKAQTNIRAFLDVNSEEGFRYEVGPFPGWNTTPVWQEWYSAKYMDNIAWEPVVDLGKIGM
jgi:serine/threonine protein kinase/WD40 repeat protein